MRECRTPKDWSLLALQNTRTGKSHYLVICKCPEHYKMEGPMAHDQPTYASVPGIRVFGMMCVKPGYPIRKPSYQPPKRYQLQKPLYHASTSNKYSNKDPSLVVSRPTYNRVPSTNYGGIIPNDTFQNQHQANYQYLNRPDHTTITNSNHHHSDSNSFNSFGGGSYGRTKGQTEIDAEGRGNNSNRTNDITPQTTIASVIREKRSVSPFDDPPFPWDRLYEFEKTINWD
uniref:Uncharacterized protein n=1 Tax=Megaselia scalaris TaxID=36166 RepID=T1H641_MEGSC